jgi:ketosteroid isomerase-like protein
MKFARVILMAAAILAGGAAGAMQLRAASGDQRQADRDAIRNHIEKIFEAYMHKDANVIRATHAADWTGFQNDSAKTIHGIDQYMADASGFLHGPVKMADYKIVEFDVVFYGDVAVVPYIADVTYEYSGQAFPQKLRVLDVYAKLNGEWNQVGSDTTVHPEALAGELTEARKLSEPEKQELLAAREAVWRDYFNNENSRLAAALPAELIAIDDGDKWHNREDVLASSKDFAASGAKLIRLEFPQTEIQVYGYTAIVYSNYLCEIESGGKRTTRTGRATEMFVHRQGKWINVGWHLDSSS